MINLVTCILILLAFALICEAAPPIQLNGSSGQAILSQIAGSVPSTNISTNASDNANLWNWGGIPFGYTLSKSGILTDQNTLSNVYSGWTPSI